MFQTAVQLAEGYTRPVIISAREVSGRVTCGVGAFVVLNTEGWVLTACHILEVLRKADQDAAKIAEREQKESAIVADASLTPGQRKSKIRKLAHDQTWISNHSYWWGQDGAAMQAYAAHPLADLALCKLSGLDTSTVPNFPVFGNNANHIQSGAYLCKLGFPFKEISASWDAAKGSFVLPNDALPLPRFPIEGMYTRIKLVVDEATDASAQYLETSSPGLRGQSGGPIFDQAGVVWAIQSHTDTYDLGFEAKFSRGGRLVSEHQAMNVGVGADIEEIMKLLVANHVEVQIQP